MERRHINHIGLLTSTSEKLEEKGIQFVDEIPRHKIALKKKGFTDRQIIDIMEMLMEEPQFCVVTQDKIPLTVQGEGSTKAAGPFHTKEAAEKWAARCPGLLEDTSWNIWEMHPPY